MTSDFLLRSELRQLNDYLSNCVFIDCKPCVECSFVTEFEDHIFVTVDAECFFFLHDLITSYVREKDKTVSSSLDFSVICSGGVE